MIKNVPFAFFVCLVAAGLTGCASMKFDGPPAIEDTNALMSYFSEQRIGFMYEGPSTAPRFSVPAQQFVVGNGSTMQVFEYTNDGAALLDISWLDDYMNGHGAPHLYRGDKMVVVYYGDDIGVMNTLSDVFGVPIA